MRAAFRDRLPEVAGKYGTPLYAMDWQDVEDRWRSLGKAFSDARILYALKANPNLGLLKRMRERLGVGFEAVSGGELERALLSGAPGGEIVLNGPGKLDGDYARAREVGATIVLDGQNEHERAARLAPGARVLLRVNPGLRVSTHDHLATGNAESKFGVPLAEVPATVAAAEAAGLEVIGLHAHIGSSISDPDDYSHALEALAGLVSQIGQRPVLDVGGGFGLRLDPAPLAALAREAAGAFGASLWIEPGRWLVAKAGVLLTRVLEVKRTGRPYVVCDAGMTELIRPMLYSAEHPVMPLDERRGEASEWDLAGPACESGDILARRVPLTGPQRGDLIAVLEAGAYGASMASNYLTRPRPAEVMLDGEQWTLLRRRDTLEDMLATERGL